MRALIAIGLTLAGAACGPRDDGGCVDDGECGAGICARNGECLPASEVRSVRVSWTIRGMLASPTTCAASPSFYLLFAGSHPADTFGYAPVPCDAGLFTVDKLPRRFYAVELGVDGGFAQVQAIDAQNMAVFDLAP
jgi:hypothetical protein